MALYCSPDSMDQIINVLMYNLWPLITTLTLMQSGCNMRSAHRLSVDNICGELFLNPSSGSKVIEQTQIIFIWPLISNCDLDLKPK